MNFGVSGFWVKFKAGVIWWTICPALVMILISLLVKVCSRLVLLAFDLARDIRGEFSYGIVAGVVLDNLVLGLIGLGGLGLLRSAFACALAFAFAFAFAVLISLWTLSRSFSLAFVAS
mgnify:CR=1 FL=1